MNQFETFLQLHHAKEPLLLANAWDVSSAKLSEANGFKAIATSSAAVADSMGYEDGEKMPFGLLLETVKQIRKHTHLPLTVDMEKGYSEHVDGIVENITRLYDAGVAGINIEDEAAGGKKQLQPAEAFEKKLTAICNYLSQKNTPVFINARTDAFLSGLAEPLTETISRIKRYEHTGVHGIFVPFVKEEKHIGAIAAATKLPLNVLTVPVFRILQPCLLLALKELAWVVPFTGQSKRILLTGWKQYTRINLSIACLNNIYKCQ